MKNCIVCGTKLKGRQQKFCSKLCKSRHNQSINGNSWDRQRKRAQDIKKEIVLSKGGQCSKCGYNNCLQALDLHHVDPKQKKFALTAREMGNMSRDKILSEADKCVVLCANCHREEHCINPEFFKPNW